MNFLSTLEISASGLYAQRRRMDVIAGNLANLETTQTEEGGPYRRKMVLMRTKSIGDFDLLLGDRVEGVKIDRIVEDKSPFKKIFNPSHPDADEDGYLRKPNIDLVVETTNMLIARRAFEANLAVLKSTRQMALKALEIGK